jgi:hypothetical protein
MQEKAADKLDPGQSDPAHPLAAVVPIAEGHVSGVDYLQTAVGKGDAKDVASQACQIGRPVEAENIRCFQHDDLGPESEVLHELVERIGQRGLHLAGQVGVDLGGAGAPVAQVFLNDPEVDPRFQQMRGVGVAQRANVSLPGDAGALLGPTEGALEAAAGDGTAVVGQTVLQTATRGRRILPAK